MIALQCCREAVGRWMGPQTWEAHHGLGIKISGLGIHFHFSHFQIKEWNQSAVIELHWLLYPVLNVIAAQNKLLFNNIASKETWNPDCTEGRFFCHCFIKVESSPKGLFFYFYFFSWMSYILPLKLHTAVLNEALLAVLEPLTSISLHKSPHQKNSYISLKVKDNNCRASVF